MGLEKTFKRSAAKQSCLGEQTNLSFPLLFMTTCRTALKYTLIKFLYWIAQTTGATGGQSGSSDLPGKPWRHQLASKHFAEPSWLPPLPHLHP